MMMYVNWFDRFQRAPHEEPTVGIVLCSEKNDAVVRFTLREGTPRIVASQYRRALPSAGELRTALRRTREEVEQRLGPGAANAGKPA